MFLTLAVHDEFDGAPLRILRTSRESMTLQRCALKHDNDVAAPLPPDTLGTGEFNYGFQVSLTDKGYGDTRPLWGHFVSF